MKMLLLTMIMSVHAAIAANFELKGPMLEGVWGMVAGQIVSDLYISGLIKAADQTEEPIDILSVRELDDREARALVTRIGQVPESKEFTGPFKIWYRIEPYFIAAYVQGQYQHGRGAFAAVKVLGSRWEIVRGSSSTILHGPYDDENALSLEFIAVQTSPTNTVRLMFLVPSVRAELEKHVPPGSLSRGSPVVHYSLYKTNGLQLHFYKTNMNEYWVVSLTTNGQIGTITSMTNRPDSESGDLPEFLDGLNKSLDEDLSRLKNESSKSESNQREK